MVGKERYDRKEELEWKSRDRGGIKRWREGNPCFNVRRTKISTVRGVEEP